MTGRSAGLTTQSKKHGPKKSKKERQVAIDVNASDEFVHAILADGALDLRRTKPGSSKLQAWPSKWNNLLSTFQNALRVDPTAVLTISKPTEAEKEALLSTAKATTLSRLELAVHGTGENTTLTVRRRAPEPPTSVTAAKPTEAPSDNGAPAEASAEGEGSAAKARGEAGPPTPEGASPAFPQVARSATPDILETGQQDGAGSESTTTPVARKFAEAAEPPPASEPAAATELPLASEPAAAAESEPVEDPVPAREPALVVEPSPAAQSTSVAEGSPARVDPPAPSPLAEATPFADTPNDAPFSSPIETAPLKASSADVESLPATDDASAATPSAVDDARSTSEGACAFVDAPAEASGSFSEGVPAVLARIPSDIPTDTAASLQPTDLTEVGSQWTPSEFADEDYSSSIADAVPPAPEALREEAAIKEAALRDAALKGAGNEGREAALRAATPDTAAEAPLKLDTVTGAGAVEGVIKADAVSDSEATASLTTNGTTSATVAKEIPKADAVAREAEATVTAEKAHTADAASAAVSSGKDADEHSAPRAEGKMVEGTEKDAPAAASTVASSGSLSGPVEAFKRQVRWLDAVGASLTQFAPSSREDGTPSTSDAAARSIYEWGQRNARGLAAGACVLSLATAAFALNGSSRKRRY